MPTSTRNLNRALRASLAGALILGLPALAPAGDADWPQIRGHGRDGVARGGELARSWGEGGPAEAWRRPIGAGFSGLSVVGGRLYTMAASAGRASAGHAEAAPRCTLRAPPGGTGSAGSSAGPRRESGRTA